MTETEEFLLERYQSILKIAMDSKEMTGTHYNMFKAKELKTLDDLETAYSELIHFITNHEYYDTLDRIEKGEALLKVEKNPDKARKYRVRLNELYIKLERLRPQEAIA